MPHARAIESLGQLRRSSRSSADRSAWPAATTTRDAADGQRTADGEHRSQRDAPGERLRPAQPGRGLPRRHAATSRSTNPTPLTVWIIRGSPSGLELAPQIRDEHVDDVAVGRPVVAPDELQQAIAAQHDPGVAREHLEQLELAPRQLDLAPAAPNAARRRVEQRSPTSTARRRGRGSSSSPPRRSSARRRAIELLDRERLDEVVVGAGLKAGDAVLDLVARGQDQDRRAHAVGAQPSADRTPAEVGHRDVEHDRRRRAARDLLQCRPAARRGRHGEALEAERALEGLRGSRRRHRRRGREDRYSLDPDHRSFARSAGPPIVDVARATSTRSRGPDAPSMPGGGPKPGPPRPMEALARNLAALSGQVGLERGGHLLLGDAELLRQVLGEVPPPMPGPPRWKRGRPCGSRGRRDREAVRRQIAAVAGQRRLVARDDRVTLGRGELFALTASSRFFFFTASCAA